MYGQVVKSESMPSSQSGTMPPFMAAASISLGAASLKISSRVASSIFTTSWIVIRPL